MRIQTLIFFALALCGASGARAEVWMVKSSGVIGCHDRATLAAIDLAQAPTTPPHDTCVELFAGERLLDQQEVGVGFNDYIRVQRHDGSTVFVKSSAVVADPGIGSPEDRAE